jgi:hypothetical protein
MSEPLQTLKPENLLAPLIRTIAITKGDWVHAEAFAEGRGWHHVAKVCKAAVTPSTYDEVGAAMRPFDDALATLIRPLAVAPRLTLRRVPVATSVRRLTSGATASFAEEGKPFAMSKESFDSAIRLDPFKLISGIVVTSESLHAIGRDANALLAGDVAASVAEAFDKRFLDPAFAESAASPASITNGATRYTSSGSTVAALDADFQKMIRALVSGKNTLETAAWIMNPVTAAVLAMTRGSGGAPAYPNVSTKGGELLGIPVVTSGAITPAGSPSESYIVLLEGSKVAIAEGLTMIDISTNAAVQMSDTPSSSASQLVSLWENNLAGIKATKYCNWSAASGSVVVLENVQF